MTAPSWQTAVEQRNRALGLSIMILADPLMEELAQVPGLPPMLKHQRARWLQDFLSPRRAVPEPQRHRLAQGRRIHLHPPACQTP